MSDPSNFGAYPRNRTPVRLGTHEKYRVFAIYPRTTPPPQNLELVDHAHHWLKKTVNAVQEFLLSLKKNRNLIRFPILVVWLPFSHPCPIHIFLLVTKYTLVMAILCVNVVLFRSTNHYFRREKEESSRINIRLWFGEGWASLEEWDHLSHEQRLTNLQQFLNIVDLFLGTSSIFESPMKESYPNLEIRLTDVLVLGKVTYANHGNKRKSGRARFLNCEINGEQQKTGYLY